MFTLLGFMGMYTLLAILFLFLVHRKLSGAGADACRRRIAKRSEGRRREREGMIWPAYGF